MLRFIGDVDPKFFDFIFDCNLVYVYIENNGIRSYNVKVTSVTQ